MSEAPIQDFFVKMVFFYRQTHPQKTYLHYTSHKSPLKPSVFVAQKWYSIKTNSQTISELDRVMKLAFNADLSECINTEKKLRNF